MKNLRILAFFLLLATPVRAGVLVEGDDDPLGGMIKGGLALGGLGLASGFFLSAELKDLNVYDDDVTDPFYIGSGMGALGLGTGVHLGNGRRGNWLLTTLASGVVGAAGAKIIVESDNKDALVVLVPAVQLVAAITLENLTTPGQKGTHDENEGGTMIGVAPTTDGGCLLIRGTF